MAAVDSIQAQTLSPEALNHLLSTNPVQIPGPQLNQQFADTLNAQLAGQINPFLAQLRTRLGLVVKAKELGGSRVLTITPKKIAKSRRRVAGIYVHGGGFALLSANDYTAYRMAHDLGVVVYSVDYDLSPRVQLPIALEQTARACRAASRQYRRVVVAGSSAGANLLFTTVLRASRGEFDPPAAAGLFSPAADLRAIGDSYVANDGRDPLLTRDTMTKLVAAYLGSTPSGDPAASPILANLRSGFVPTVINTGTRDLLLSDGVRLHRTMRDAGLDIRLRVWEGMWHAFEGVPGLPEGDRALGEVFGFLEQHL
ncbi:alpha/beta hydrolase [Pseudonocardia parietis]|nr:alpha/beta hydrolase [Pseudonocardia parietis]